MRLAVMSMMALLLAGCGYDRAPREFRPASRDCGTLAGDYLVDEADLRWLDPERRLPAGGRFPFLTIQEQGRGMLTLVLHRRTSDVLSEATTLRLTKPDEYRAWRAWVLGEPPDSQLSHLSGASVGPMVSRRWEMSTRACDGGWRDNGAGVEITPRAGSEDVRHLAFLGLARGEDGELLVRRQVRRERTTGLSFRDQSIRYYRYAYSDWHRIAAAPPGTLPTPPTARDLPTVPDRMQRMQVQFARDEQWGRFKEWMRANLPPDTTVTIFRERQMDPVAMLLPADQRRIEIAGHWTIDAPDPFTPLLASRPDVSDIELKQSRRQANNRPYRLIEFTLTAQP